MTQEITTIRLLALAYAKGRLTRSEYLQKRSQQLSALEFGQTQPPVDETNTLVRTVSEEIPYLQDARVRYFDGRGDPMAAARLRKKDSEHMLSDAENLEYRSANRLVIVAGIIIVVALFLQLLGFMAQESQREHEAVQLQEVFKSQTVDVARELNIEVGVETKELTPQEYDKLAGELLLGKALARILEVDLEELSVRDVAQISDMVRGSSEEDQKVLVSTSWFDAVVGTVELYSDNLDESLNPGNDNPELARMDRRQLKKLRDRRNIFLEFYADLADMQLQYSE